MREQTCCITGQHLRPGEDREQLTQRLRNIIGQLTARDVTHFVMGGAPGFELLAGELLLELRQEDSRITLTAMLPHKDVSKGWKREDVARRERLLAQADEVIYTSFRKEAGVCAAEEPMDGGQQQRVPVLLYPEGGRGVVYGALVHSQGAEHCQPGAPGGGIGVQKRGGRRPPSRGGRTRGERNATGAAGRVQGPFFIARGFTYGRSRRVASSSTASCREKFSSASS